MGDLVNLKRHRKRLAREEAAAQAASNRNRFGRSREAQRSTAADAERQDRLLDGKRLVPGNAAPDIRQGTATTGPETTERGEE